MRRPSDADVASLQAEQSEAPFTYDEVGATQAELPAGYTHARQSLDIGRGRPAFARAVEGLRQWQAHRGAGIDVFPPDAPIAVGTTVVQRAGIGVHLIAACRIVYVVDEPRTFGFAYGTLPVHPEAGEERFLVTIDDDDVVQFEVRVFFRPRHLLTRIGRPVTKIVQAQVTKRYLRGLQNFVKAEGSAG